MHPLPEPWVVYCVQWEDAGSAFPAPGPMRNRGTGDPVEMLGGHKGWREDEVKTDTASTMWTSLLCGPHRRELEESRTGGRINGRLGLTYTHYYI